MLNIIRRFRTRKTLKAVAQEARHWTDANHANAEFYAQLHLSLRYSQKDDPFSRELADRIADVAGTLAKAEELANQYELEALVAEHRYANA